MTHFLLAAFLAFAAGDADALIEEGRYDEAREVLSGQLEQAGSPEEKARVLDRIGLTYLYEGRWWEAETRFAGSVELHETGLARLHRGRAFFGAGRETMGDGTALGAEIRSLMNDAARELRRAVVLLPDSAEAFIALGLAERYRGDTPAEIKAFERALELAPGDPSAALHLAWRLEAQGDRAGATRTLESVLEERRTVEHWKQLGRLAEKGGEEKAAAEYYTAAAVADPEDWDAFAGIWGVTAIRRHFGAFNEAMASVLERHEKAWLPHYYLGFSRLDDGKPEEALAEFARAYELNPSLVRARVMVADVLMSKLSRREEGVAVYREVLEKEPGNERARMALAETAMAYARDGMHAAAGTLFEALAKADPTEPVHLMNLALTLKERGRFDEALALYQQAEEAFPFEPQIPNDRALLLMGAGRREEAMAAFREALSRDEEFLDTLENLGAYSLLEGDLEAALTWFGKAHRRVMREGGDASKFRRYLDLVNGEIRGAR